MVELAEAGDAFDMRRVIDEEGDLRIEGDPLMGLRFQREPAGPSWLDRSCGRPS